MRCSLLLRHYGINPYLLQALNKLATTNNILKIPNYNQYSQFPPKIQAVFKLYDRDNTNKLNGYEMREALGSAGYHLNNHILNSLVYRYGAADKTISFDDFIMCAVKVKTMIEHYKEKDFNNTNQATFTMDEWITRALYS